jgi:hypothetical protein
MQGTVSPNTWDFREQYGINPMDFAVEWNLPFRQDEHIPNWKPALVPDRRFVHFRMVADLQAGATLFEWHRVLDQITCHGGFPIARTDYSQ